MGGFGLSWPTEAEVDEIRNKVSQMAGKNAEEVRVVVSPYRICPLGAHIDHQASYICLYWVGGTVSAMTIDKGILLGFIPSGDTQVVLQSGQFKGEVRIRVDEIQRPKHTVKENYSNHASESGKVEEECSWGNYARGALYALQSRGNNLSQGIIGYICGSKSLDSSGLSSSAAVGVAYLLAFECANSMEVSPVDNIEYDRLIENEYLGLRNGILDQSAILLSSYGCLTCMNCKTKEYKLIQQQKFQENHKKKSYKILLALSGLKGALTNNPGYNHRVAECQEAARVILWHLKEQLLHLEKLKWSLCCAMAIEEEDYEAHKSKLDANLAKRAEHYFSENKRVIEGTMLLFSWKSGDLEKFGKLISNSGLSSIQNYECGSEPLIQLNAILQGAPGVFGARFSGAGFRGCCIALVDANLAEEAASYIRKQYQNLQPQLASQINKDAAVSICEAGDCAHVI
ncbi:hypothetical protein EZV62_012495 [Acer yangbiense]|uniref:Galacturonokinase n=1 Tax=Acer yangbiense TaxID=1000413 RepID=A0A5C7HY84_9ROSI|nr:hypothetical protein EZV62_012495 [Acer yangbiense]